MQPSRGEDTLFTRNSGIVQSVEQFDTFTPLRMSISQQID
jgi:hypothetical protein